MYGHGFQLLLLWVLFGCLLYSPHLASLSSIDNSLWHSIDSEFTSWLDSIDKRLESQPHFSQFMNRDFNVTTLTVDLHGNGNFTSIQKAVDSIPLRNNHPYVIKINAGTYVEKVQLSRYVRRITLQGQGRESTIIVWNDTASTANSTFGSATVAVDSHDFTAFGITVRNSAPAQPPGAVRQQAVALRTSGDNSAFYDCAFEGHQDTLYDNKGRHYFKNCYIEGSIDFIFGNGQSLYKNCDLQVVPITPGALTAQKRAKEDSTTGFIFLNCNITGSGIAYLGRAWGRYSRVLYMYTYIGDIIIPAGWYNWGKPARNETVFYGQYKCYGPGAAQMQRVLWAHELTDAEAQPFLLDGGLAFIEGESWVPQQ